MISFMFFSTLKSLGSTPLLSNIEHRPALQPAGCLDTQGMACAKNHENQLGTAGPRQGPGWTTQTVSYFAKSYKLCRMMSTVFAPSSASTACVIPLPWTPA